EAVRQRRSRSHRPPGARHRRAVPGARRRPVRAGRRGRDHRAPARGPPPHPG
ncbi:MAG: Pyridoxine 5'-phosphate synthase, partial [uncultured Gemmatimonadetes bacterium]